MENTRFNWKDAASRAPRYIHERASSIKVMVGKTDTPYILSYDRIAWNFMST